MKTYHTVVPAAYALLVKDGEVLMIRRFKPGYWDGHYSLPAGHTKRGEGSQKAAIREALEEVGIHIEPLDVEIAHVMHRLAQDAHHKDVYERIDIFFRVNRWEGE